MEEQYEERGEKLMFRRGSISVYFFGSVYVRYSISGLFCAGTVGVVFAWNFTGKIREILYEGIILLGTGVT